MKKIMTVFALLLFLGSISFGQVDKDYARTLKTLFEVSGSEDSYVIVINQLIDIFKKQYPDISTEIWDELEKDFLKSAMNDLVDMLAPVYFNYLTQEDLEGLIEFYKTPLGAKYAKQTPSLTQESMQVGQEWGSKIGQEFVNKMKEKGY